MLETILAIALWFFFFKADLEAFISKNKPSKDFWLQTKNMFL